jgi:hypothetical protein
VEELKDVVSIVKGLSHAATTVAVLHACRNRVEVRHRVWIQ